MTEHPAPRTRLLVSAAAAAVMALPLVAVACTSEPDRPAPRLEPVTVQLRWTHQAQFAGMYAAAVRGYYRDQGLKVRFLEGGAGKDVIWPLITGRAQFSVAGGLEVVQSRAQDKPVKAVAAVYRRSPEAFVALKSSGIQSPRDFAGKRVNREPGDVPLLHAMTSSVGVPPSRYTEVRNTDNMDALLSGRADVINAFLMNEPDLLRQKGHQVVVFSPDDYGVHAYADVLVTTDQFIDAEPAVVRDFVRATIRGWEYAVDNPGQVAALVARYNPRADKVHETEFMAISRPLIATGVDSIGFMRPQVWREMAQLLRRERLIPSDFDPTSAYTDRFLPRGRAPGP